MSVVIETTLGDITVDLYLDQRPVTCLNFLKLCKMKYYNFNLFHSIRSGFIAQTGDPTGEGSGGESIWGILEGPQKRFFSGEKLPKIRHTDAGLISMVCTDDMMVGSQFFFTLAPDLDSLDSTHCVIGEVTEGREVLSKLNDVICDEAHRPYRDVRITHTVILEDPFNDPSGLRAPSRSPSPNPERLKGGRIAPDEEIDETLGKSTAEIQELIEEKEAKARATILEIVGDLPDADIAPPENVLFVCKLNPVTTDDDLEIIFSRFGKIISCEVIRDKSSGNSLQYAFIEFDDKKSCEDAYFKMDNVLIDDRRIHVDFSQSVSRMKWLGKGRGVQYFDNDGKEQKSKNQDRDIRKDKNYGKSVYDENNRKKEHHGEKNKHQNREENFDKVNREKDIKYDRDRNNKIEKRDRSRSRHRSRERVRNGEDKKHNSSKKSHESRHNNSSSNRHSSTHRSSHRRGKESPPRKHLHKEKTSYNDSSYNSKNEKEQDSFEKKHRSKNEKGKNVIENNRSRKRRHSHNNVEPQTPSPVTKPIQSNKKKLSKSEKETKVKDEKSLKKGNKKRKRKVSTSSSDSDSSDSTTTSSETSSSSGTDHKKRKVKRKRKVSTSSSSSSSSSDSSSSSSSSESSTTSSSSSDSEARSKSKKTNNKNIKKTRKK